MRIFTKFTIIYYEDIFNVIWWLSELNVSSGVVAYMTDDTSFISGEYFLIFKATQAALESSVKLFLMSDFIKFIADNSDSHE